VTAQADQAAAWVYRGIWSVLSGWFRVPDRSPTLPARPGERLLSFHPSRRYLRYLKLYFWILLVVIDVAIAIGWLAVFIAAPPVGVVLAVPAAAVAILPDIVAYVAIHLRYDTMWYVMGERSLRCRRGIWTILEHTITFENVQNVAIRRGPIQALYGISTILIETAGAAAGEGQNEFAVGNKAIMEGIENPAEIRELILERVRRSKTAGLGDESPEPTRATPGWTAEYVAVLGEIRDAVRSGGR
jgi:membrane protein YdbS with pleckstrin-like domain